MNSVVDEGVVTAGLISDNREDRTTICSRCMTRYLKDRGYCPNCGGT